jgi:hypothetical protein
MGASWIDVFFIFYNFTRKKNRLNKIHLVTFGRGVGLGAGAGLVIGVGLGFGNVGLPIVGKSLETPPRLGGGRRVIGVGFGVGVGRTVILLID